MAKDNDCDGTVDVTWVINYATGPDLGIQYWYLINAPEITYTTYWSLCDNTYMDTNIGSDFDNFGNGEYIYIG